MAYHSHRVLSSNWMIHSVDQNGFSYTDSSEMRSTTWRNFLGVLEAEESYRPLFEEARRIRHEQIARGLFKDEAE
jgi:hypothetical protein